MRSGPADWLRNFLRALDPRKRAQPRRGDEDLHGVLFVCSGNICRSPTAEAVFRVMAARAGIADRLRIDSAGTQRHHVGQPPDRRAVRAAKARGFDMPRLRARQVTPEDFLRFHWIFAMDRANLRALDELRPPAFAGSLGLYLDLVPDVAARDVPDPYYGGAAGFERLLDLVEPASEALVVKVAQALRDEPAEGPGAP
jgi:protein-tyrosine phosphatase